VIFDGDRDELGTYIRHMADLLGLRDWTINLLADPPDNARYAADVDVIYGRRCAEIRVAADWMHRTPESLRTTIAHELLHCHLNPSRNVLDNMQHAIGQMLYTTAYNALTDYIEYATDAISTAWAEFLPLPVKDAESDATDEQEAA